MRSVIVKSSANRTEWLLFSEASLTYDHGVLESKESKYRERLKMKGNEDDMEGRVYLNLYGDRQK